MEKLIAAAPQLMVRALAGDPTAISMLTVGGIALGVGKLIKACSGKKDSKK
ncbi:MAG: hypothetical protein HFG65_16500 [Hungatella sp.]|nr:hypothetical protein [Hungatella sp.]